MPYTEMENTEFKLSLISEYAKRNKHMQFTILAHLMNADLLGFTHFCDKTRNGRFKLGRKTSRKKFVAKTKEMSQWLKGARNLRRPKIGEKFYPQNCGGIFNITE